MNVTAPAMTATFFSPRMPSIHPRKSSFRSFSPTFELRTTRYALTSMSMMTISADSAIGYAGRKRNSPKPTTRPMSIPRFNASRGRCARRVSLSAQVSMRVQRSSTNRTGTILRALM